MTTTTRQIRRIRTSPATSGVDSRVDARIQALSSTRHRADVSRQVDADNQVGIMGGTAPLVPPYDINSILTTYDQSNMLRQCIAAYVTNIAMYGWEIAAAEEKTPIDEAEREELQSFIDNANSDESLTTVHAKVVEEYEKLGHAYLEVIRDSKGRVSILRHAKGSLMRICPKHPDPVLVRYDVRRGPRTAYVSEHKLFRLYVQVVGGRSTYFKEFGDPRKLDRVTGRFAGTEGPVAKEREATEIIHFRQNSEDAYGLPRWINQLPSILGSRESEEVNLRYFEDNTVPPMILSVAGGRLTSESFREMKTLLNNKGLGKERQNQILLIEAVPERESLEDRGNVQLKIDKLTDTRPSDGLFKDYDESNQAKIRSSFRLPPVSVGLSQDVTFACYDDATETLTDRGWVSRAEWRTGMKVATYDPLTEGIMFEEPQGGMQEYDVSGVEMYRISSEQQSMLVTPGHRMLCSPQRDSLFGILPVEGMAERARNYVKTAGQYVGGERQSHFEVPHLAYQGGIAALDAPVGTVGMDTLLQWLGYYIADGSQSQRGCAVRIGAKKIRKVLRFSTVHEQLAEAGFRVREDESCAGTYFSVSHKGMASWLAVNAGECSATKRVPDMVWALPADQLRVLFDALMECDGTWDSREGRTSGAYSTISTKLADDVQRLAVMLGYRAQLRSDRPGAFGEAPVYRVLLSVKDTAQLLTDRHVSREEYTGKVYCFTVSTGVFITRRNGKVAFQGNTANVSAFIAETQVFAPSRAAFDEVYNKRFVNSIHGLHLKTVVLRSAAPAITNPEMLIKSLTALNVMGAVTPRMAQQAANKILQIDLVEYPKVGEEGYEEWMDKPIIFVNKGQSGNTGIDPAFQGNPQDAQAQKDEAVKVQEATGEVRPASPENGQQ